MHLSIQKLSPNDLPDFSALLRVFETIFEWENFTLPNPAHLQKMIGNPTFIAMVAKAENQVIGGLTAYVLDSYQSEQPMVYLYDVAILAGFQQQGIGKKLIATLLEYSEQQGFSEVFVQAETQDEHAIDFYRATPVSSEVSAIQFGYTLDKTRPQ